MNETIIAIDPDSNGAVAIRHKGEEVTIESLRFVAPGEVDLSWLKEFLSDFDHGLDLCGDITRVYLERQRPIFVPSHPLRPKRLSKLSKCPTCGRAEGQYKIAIHSSLVLTAIEHDIKGLLVGMDIPVESIPPGSWKKCFVRGKEAMLPVASRMFPSVVWTGNKLKKEGQATALMLAEWGRREREGRPK